MMIISGKLGTKSGQTVGVLGIVILIAGLLGLNCSRAPEKASWFQCTTTGANLSPEELLRKIQGVGSLFDLYEMKREFILAGGAPGEEILPALDRQRDQLVYEAESFPAIPGALEFLGWRIRPASEVPTRQWAQNQGKYEISGYFVVTGRLERDWIFRIMTKVDGHHISFLPPDRQKAGYLNWQIFPKTSSWSPGEHHILSTILELQSIPYYIYARMYLYPEYINQADFVYGWFADPDIEQVPDDHPVPR